MWWTNKGEKLKREKLRIGCEEKKECFTWNTFAYERFFWSYVYFYRILFDLSFKEWKKKCRQAFGGLVVWTSGVYFSLPSFRFLSFLSFTAYAICLLCNAAPFILIVFCLVIRWFTYYIGMKNNQDSDMPSNNWLCTFSVISIYTHMSIKRERERKSKRKLCVHHRCFSISKSAPLFLFFFHLFLCAVVVDDDDDLELYVYYVWMHGIHIFGCQYLIQILCRHQRPSTVDRWVFIKHFSIN